MAHGRVSTLPARRAAMTAARWLLLAGWCWDWALALALIIINFTVPGEIIPAVDRLYFADDPAFRCVCCRNKHTALRAGGTQHTAITQ